MDYFREVVARQQSSSSLKCYAVRNLAGPLVADGGGCTLSDGQKVKLEITDDWRKEMNVKRISLVLAVALVICLAGASQIFAAVDAYLTIEGAK